MQSLFSNESGFHVRKGPDATLIVWVRRTISPLQVGELARAWIHVRYSKAVIFRGNLDTQILPNSTEFWMSNQLAFFIYTVWCYWKNLPILNFLEFGKICGIKYPGKIRHLGNVRESMPKALAANDSCIPAVTNLSYREGGPTIILEDGINLNTLKP